MTDPMTALLAGAAIMLLIALLCWPRSGALARWQRLRSSGRRVLMEDALKHLYDCEYRNLICTQQSIAGTLSISGDEAAGLLARLEELGLLRSHGDVLIPTEEGRSYALRIIRVHRLWERYLADETGMSETDWHRHAERREHEITPAQADMLSVRMGNPRFDPHGDPIPTSTGELPHPKGQPLTVLSPGDVAEIVHVEDEPAMIYEQIVALGLNPGMRLRLLSATKERIRFDVEGVECVLAPVAAGNITVQAVTREERVAGPHDSLDGLRAGEEGVVVGLSRSCRGLQRRRLMDLGLVPGTLVRNEMSSAGGDPTAYLIRGATIALRRRQARMIHIKRAREMQ